MGWQVGEHNGRDIGYGVPATCDQPGCGASIDRGLSYVCGGQPYGGDVGCGLFFCAEHRHCAELEDTVGELVIAEVCERCRDDKEPFARTPDTAEWNAFKDSDPSWAEWRAARAASGLVACIAAERAARQSPPTPEVTS